MTFLLETILQTIMKEILGVCISGIILIYIINYYSNHMT